MCKFFIVTSFGKELHGMKEKEVEANNLSELIDEIKKTQRGKMEYQIYSKKPFCFENLLYKNESTNFKIKIKGRNKNE